MKIPLTGTLAMLFAFSIGCQNAPEYAGARQNTAQAVIGDEDHAPSTAEEEANEIEENLVAVEDVQSEVEENVVEDNSLSPADILRLDVVEITANGDVGANSSAAELGLRYTDPNGLPLNDPANMLTLKQGQTFQVCNNGQTGNVRIHTNGQPFGHGANIPAGSCTDYTLNSTVTGSGNNIYDHNLGGPNGNRVVPIYIRVVSEAEAQDIIAASL